MSQGELQRMTRRYANGISHVIGVYRDIPAPDMNTNAQTMAWFMDAYSARERLLPGHRHREAGRRSAASPAARRPPASASCSCSRPTAKEHDIDMAGCPVVIQGFGNVGSFAAMEAAARGAKIVGVSDRFGAIYHEHGPRRRRR